MDLQIICNELQFLTSYRLQNIYDLRTSSRQFLFKFAVPNSKKLVVIDPGFRAHLTEYARQTTQTPSGFVAKLRKHLKTRRLTVLRSAPASRVLVLTFSDDAAFHLVIEFFAGGNMILLDRGHKILSLQRIVPASENQRRCAVGETYPLDELLDQQGYLDSISEELVKSWLGMDSKTDGDTADPDSTDPINLLGGKKAVKEKVPSLKKLLYSKLPGMAPGIIENALLEYEIDGNTPYNTAANLNRIADIVSALHRAKIESLSLVSKGQVTGYILAKKNTSYKGSDDSTSTTAIGPDRAIDPNNIEYLFEDFQPFPIRLPDDKSFKLVECSTFNQAVDTYFSTFEATKVSLRFASQAQVAERRLSAARAEKEKRVQGLTQVQEKSFVLGLALQTYADRVEEAAEAVKGLINQGMDWQDIEKLIEIEQSRQNTVAQMINLPLNLNMNKITVILPDPMEEKDDFESESDSEDFSDSESSIEEEEINQRAKTKQVKVEIDLGMSAWANSRKYFEVKKNAAAKQERTVQQAEFAYKSAEKKIQRDLKATLEKNSLQQTMLHTIREPFWFEKFFWFLSTDGYLVLGGRDRFQNDLLLTRYFKKNDVYVHCDVEGASVVIVKNFLNVPEIPPSTLTQAGALAVCTSKAWDNKILTSAWWAHRDQIPKLSPQGDIITSSRIIVKGAGKQYLPPCPLDMGLGFFWMVKDESLSKYSKRYGRDINKTEDHPESESDKEFPDTALDSDEEFPDTQLDSESEGEESEEETKELTKKDEEEDSTSVTKPDNEPIGDNTRGQSVNKQAIHPAHPDIAGDSGSDRQTPYPSFGKRLSAKQRREMRKQRAQVPGTSSSTPDSREDSPTLEIEKALDSLKVKSSKDEFGQQQKPPKPPTMRGKKGKLKKIATKYADQDEEERQLRMDILGTTKGLEKQAQEERISKQRREEQEQQRRERQKRAKEAEMKRLLAEDDEEVSQEWTELVSNLVPRLAPGDEPTGIVPVFAPWQALQKFKVKIKFQPGTLKKGKAVKDILRAIHGAKTDPTGKDPDYIWPNELSMIRSLKEPELILLVAVGRTKVTIPGQGQSQGQKSSVKGGKKKGKR